MPDPDLLPTLAYTLPLLGAGGVALAYRRARRQPPGQTVLQAPHGRVLPRAGGRSATWRGPQPPTTQELSELLLEFGTPQLDEGGAVSADTVVDRAIALRPLPEAAQRVMTALDDDRGGSGRIVSALERDEALAAAVLRVANSSGFRSAGDAADLPSAVTRLGRQHLRTLVLATGLLGAEDSASVFARRARSRVLAQAASGRVIARYLSDVPSETAYVVCLLMDVGHLMLPAVIGPDFEALYATAHHRQLAVAPVEAGWLGFTHADVGALLAEAWGFPPVITDAIRVHEAPVPRDEHDDDDVVRLAAVASLADAVALALEAGLEGDHASLVGHPAQNELALHDSVLSELVAECKREAFEAGAVFG